MAKTRFCAYCFACRPDEAHKAGCPTLVIDDRWIVETGKRIVDEILAEQRAKKALSGE